MPAPPAPGWHPDLSWLLLPGIPIVAAGQIWAIFIVAKRRGGRQQRLTLSDIKGSLPARYAIALAAIFVIGWLIAVISMVQMGGDGPSAPTPTCPYPLSSHGMLVACVPRSAYLSARADEQRFASSILLGFFSIHTLILLGTTSRQTTWSGVPAPG